MTGTGAQRRFDERERTLLAKFLRSVGSNHVHEAEAARAAIDRLLKQFGKAWADLVELLGGSPASIHPDLVRDLAGLGSDDYAGARGRIDELLERHRRNWNDLVDELCALAPASWVGISSRDPDLEPDPDLLSLLIGTLKRYVDLKPSEYVTVAVWILHSHCYRNFMITPRLVLRSPTPGCGKTVLMDILQRLTARGARYGSLTAAALLRLIDATHPTLMLDEFDNLGIQQNGTLRALLNEGHRAGGTRAIVIDGEVKTFEVFTPVALALPDASGGLTRTLDSRAITIAMEISQRELESFDINHLDGTLDGVYGQILIWRSKAKLDPNPQMPAGTLNRVADNWRALLSVADSLGHGALVRGAMLEMNKAHKNADCKVELLTDIRALFDLKCMPDEYAADRFPSKALLAALHDLDESDWGEFRGIRGDEAPHKLRASEMMAMLSAFNLKTRTIWPNGKRIKGETKSARGYERSQFEVTWKKYCDTPAQTTHPNKIMSLRAASSGT
jgi:hypothetical protein